ncbi:conserved membrane hypothetical protein [Candidatus Sulfopaludibacter sp. SbA4]|nr:conserved membrane hypothetical protein [Candidatus Sulfopaludibacter sp. SbA4]
MLQIPYDPTANPLNNNEWSFPLFECIHIAMFAMSIGTIAIVDFRLLGLAMRRQSPAELMKATWLWTLIGLTIVIMTGLVIFSSDPVRYYYNPAFRYKCIALVGAIVYNYTIHRKAAMSNAGPVVGGLVGSVSLLLWISVVFAGIFYSFV